MNNHEQNTAARKITCIVCPLSCVGMVEVQDAAVVRISGFTCKRGQDYAASEAIAPKRTLTTTVRISGGTIPMLPVVSASPLPKEMIEACVQCLSCVAVKAPVREGDLIYKNILGLGIDILASRDIDETAVSV